MYIKVFTNKKTGKVSYILSNGRIDMFISKEHFDIIKDLYQIVEL